MFVLITPGSKTAFVSLQSVLKERHEHLRSSTAKEIERRTARGVPLDDGDGPIVALDPYVDIPGYEDVKIRFVALSAQRRADLMADAHVAAGARAVFAGQPLAEIAKQVIVADAAVEAAQLALIRAAIDELQTSDGKADLGSDAVVDAIKATGSLFAHLFVAARDYQGLSPSGERRFGSAPPSTT